MKKLNKKQQKEFGHCDNTHVYFSYLFQIIRIFSVIFNILFFPLQPHKICFSDNLKANSSQNQNIYIGVGEQRLLSFQNFSRFTIGSPQYIRSLPIPTHLHSNQILIKGLKEGLTDIQVWNKDGSTEKKTIHIFEWKKDALPKEILPLLHSLKESEIIPYQKKVLLRGTITDLNELKTINQLKEHFPTFIYNETSPQESLCEHGYIQLNEWIAQNKHLGLFKLEKSNHSLFLEMKLKNHYSIDAIKKEIKSIYPDTLISLDQQQSEYPSIHFQIYLIEIQKNFLQSIGIKWPDSLHAQIFNTSSMFSTVQSLDFSLEHLEEQGSLKILSQPQLVVKSPGEAELFSGGEIPITQKTKNLSKTEWKNYGLSLKLKVNHASFFGVRLEIETEMSSLDKSISTTDTPGIQSNRMKTHVESEFNKILLLSGLLQHKMTSKKQGIPWLVNIPLIGLIFGSQDYIENKTELVALLIPQKKPKDISSRTLEKISPEGPLPPPRQWLDPDSEIELTKSPEYPWNAFKH